MSYDVIIAHGTVMPGDAPGYRSDVGIVNGRITALAPHLPQEDTAQVIDATHHWVCPGFIDLHAHSALEPFQHPALMPKIAQGFTTEVIHPDGLAPAPVRSTERDERQAYLDGLEGHGPDNWSWSSLQEFLTVLHATQPATTLVPSVGHNAIRDLVMGSGNRPATPDEIKTMQRELQIAAELGARMFSLGLIYLPGVYADTAELISLAQEAQRVQLPLMPHIRNEATLVVDALQEVIGVCRTTDASLHVSHLKVVGASPHADSVLEVIERGSQDIDLTFDQYPYGAGSTLLTAVLPPWALEGGPAAITGRLATRATREKIKTDILKGLPGWENLYRTCGPDNITIADVNSNAKGLVGLSLAEIASARSQSPLDLALDLLEEAQLNVTMIDHYATEDTVRQIFRHRLALVGTDGIFGFHPHPRLYGTAARVLGRYAIHEHLISPDDAVFRLTAGAADRLRLADRGRIRQGLRADLVVLNPDTYIDTATYAQPHQYPTGVSHVLVAGQVVWTNGHATGARPGGVLNF